MSMYERLSTFLARKLGRCGRCIRSSTGCAALAWCASGVVWVTWANRAALVTTIGVALAFTILTVTHFVVYGVRVTRSLEELRARQRVEAGMQHALVVLDRRRFVAAVVVATAAGLFATLAAPVLRAHAACRAGVPCGNTGYCCDPGWYYCDFCDGQRHKCVPPTDEALKVAQACCGVLVRC